jgi:uncharacterized protein YbbK (DUF523 family)
MSTPREPIQLVADENGVTVESVRVRLLGVKSFTDWTETMVMYSAARVKELAAEQLDGYILKADSPSCGLHHVRVQRGDEVTRSGRGLFAEALVRALPDLPVEDEERLRDLVVRESFVSRIRLHQQQRLHRSRS